MIFCLTSLRKFSISTVKTAYQQKMPELSNQKAQAFFYLLRQNPYIFNFPAFAYTKAKKDIASISIVDVSGMTELSVMVILLTTQDSSLSI